MLNDTLRGMENQQSHFIRTLDLQSEDQVKGWFKNLTQEIGVKLDGMVYSAGVHYFTSLRSVNQNHLLEMWNVNIHSLIHLIGGFSNKIISNDGASIVLLSSASSIKGEKGVVGYSATKGAVNSIVKSAAAELSPRSIRVNSILPGVVETNMSKQIERNLTEEQYRLVKEKHLLGIGKPEDIAYSIGYLLSPASRWVTGTNLIIDGGYTL